MTLQQPKENSATQIDAIPRGRFVRRQETGEDHSHNATSSTCIVALAAIGLLALGKRRIEFDSWNVLMVEFCVGAGLIGLMIALRNRRYSAITTPLLATAIVLMPWVVNQFSRFFGNGNDAAMVLLTNLAWGGAALAVASRATRTQNLSAVCSGFLTLFSVFTADSPEITLFVYLWMAVCLWWLVSRHWAGVSTLDAANVQSSLAARLTTLGVGCGAFIVAILLISDSVPVLRKLRAEVAPTSGGTSQKDKSARRGVGNGDALIAAKNHATSFGPVETDFFLDSPKPSLFDVFSDEFGEPIRRKKAEKAQALSPNEVRSEEGKFSDANRSSGGEFSIEREAAKPQPLLEDLHSDALMFFEGRAGIRLAVQRYDSFGDNCWTRSKSSEETTALALQPATVEIEDELWFAPPGVRVHSSLSPFASSIPEALRFTRYGDNSIPIALGMQLWRIDQLTRADFFAFTGDWCLAMPGRVAVPDYTVVRFVNSQLDAEKLHQHMRTCAPGLSHLQAETTCSSEISRLAHRYGDQHERGLEQVQSIVRGLKNEFTVSELKPPNERIDQGALERFLKERQGPSYLFATTAALMLDHFGYEIRLVTGFYVNPDHFDRSQSATAILPSDAHCWIEVNSGHGYWVPFEPTPGFREPPMRSTWAFWLSRNWRRFVRNIAIALAASIVLFTVRGWLFNAVLLFIAPLFRFLPQKRRLTSLRALLDLRWSFIGAKRPSSVTPRRRLNSEQWGLNETQQAVATQFFDAYEAQRFGSDVDTAAVKVSVSAMPSIIRSVKRNRKKDL